MPKKTPSQPSEKKPTDEALATLMLDRQERTNRCAQAIDEVCKKERVRLVVSGFKISADGRIGGEIQVVALD